MPRPKILPENRIRGYRACGPCKASKIRCDSQLPCANCTRKSRVAHCKYAASSSTSRRAKQTNRDTEGQEQRYVDVTGPVLHHVSTSRPLEPAVTVTVTDGVNRRSSVAQPAAAPTATSEPSPLLRTSASEAGPSTMQTEWTGEEQDSPQEHFVTGPNGETLYISENASLSFLDFLRHSMKQLVGVTGFTDAQPQNLNLMLDADVNQVADIDISLSVEEKTALFQSYSAVSSGILRLFSDDEAQSLIASDLQNAHSGNQRDDLAAMSAAMSAALAIGAQTRSSGPRDAQCASTLFIRARAVAFENMLANPSVSIVRLFVLLSFYTLGAFRQIPASIYLGIASKAAVVLGLHQPMSPKAIRQGGDYTSRLRIWHSLCILDVLASSLLGRPCTVPRATRHKIQSLPLDPRQPAFNSILKGAVILDDVCCVLNRGTDTDASGAQDLLIRLRSWCSDLPLNLKKFSCKDVASMSREDEQQLVGKLHVSSVYYFAIILLTRPFMIRHLMPGIRRRVGIPTQESNEPGGSVLAQVCVNSAVHMGQLCRDVAVMVGASGRSLNMMSLFKAWAFGSGLILGFAMLAGETRHDVNDAFQGVQRLLGLSEESKPQSQLYTETLRAFSYTISIYQRLASLSSTRPADQYVQKVLSIDTGSKSQAPPPPVDTFSQHPALSSWDSGGQPCDLTLIEGMSGTTSQTEIHELPLGYHDWNDFSVPFSGDFEINFDNGLL